MAAEAAAEAAEDAEDAEDADATESHELKLLPYQQDILEELLEHDGVTVIGKGLGLATIAASILALHHWAADSGGVAIVIGTTQPQRKQIASELARIAPAAPLVPDVTAEMSARDRTAAYTATKHLFITTRILVVDFLTGRLQPSQVAGLVILNAHRASDQSGEGFAVKLLRAKNSAAFVRGLSDDATSCSAGLSTTERMLRALQVKKLFLWPRYQVEIQDNLRNVDVCEVQCELSSSMVDIQQALVRVLDSMLKQVQRTNRLDSSELSLSHAFSRAFDATIQRQLAPIWTRVSASTRTLIRDMRTVQELIKYLLRFNPVSLLRYLQCLRAAAGSRTEWMLHSGANTVFQEAKARVYKVNHPPPTAGKKSEPRKPVLVPVLEEMPKWQTLREIVEEIQTARGLIRSRAAAAPAGGSAPAQHANEPSVARGVSSNARSAADQNAALDADQGAALDADLPPHKRSRPAPQTIPETTGAAGHIPSDEDDDVVLVEGGSGRGAAAVGAAGEPSTSPAGDDGDPLAWVQQQSDAAIAACGPDATALIVTSERRMVSELRSVLRIGGRAYLQQLYDMYLLERAVGEHEQDAGEAASAPSTGVKQARSSGAAGKRGRGRGRAGMTKREQGMYRLQMLSASNEEEHALASAAHDVLDAIDAARADGAGGATAPAERAKKRSRAAAAAAGGRAGKAQAAAAAAPAADTGPLLQGLHFLAMEDASEHLLYQIKPVFVVLYDLDLAWVRLLEAYQSAFPDLPLKVYLLFYSDSVDLHMYQLSAAREKESFKKLIGNKAHMVLPIDTGGQLAVVPKQSSELARSAYLSKGALTGNALTRRAGGIAALGSGRPGRIVVDIREFMSELPAVLYGRGFEIAPVTLEVADFVLSDGICVERKAIPDLVSSLDSGRLYTQATAMAKHYRTPILLIEFDASKAFAFQSVADIGTDIRGNNVASKLVLLLHNFPTLRLVWSRSLHATADMFAMLKNLQPEPDAERAAEVGLEDSEEGRGDDVANPVARDMLLAMPGVSMANVNALMDAAESLLAVTGMSLAELQAAIGKISGKQLHDFLHTPYPAS